MKGITLLESGYTSYVPKNHVQYLKFMKILMKNTDRVCLTVKPFLDDIEEFNHSRWSFLKDNIISISTDEALVDPKGYKSALVMLKNNYILYDFFINKKGISDFEEDKELGITLQDPVFINKNKVICFTLTHEDECCVAEDIYACLNL